MTRTFDFLPCDDIEVRSAKFVARKHICLSERSAILWIRGSAEPHISLSNKGDRTGLD